MPSTVEIARDGVAADGVALGRDVYNFRCYFCHGYNGDARTLASTYLTPPPRDFTALPLAALSRGQMIEVVRDGKPGTAMKGFSTLLTRAETEAVVDFVRTAFMGGTPSNTRYHTPANGWPDHHRYAAAFPFAVGEIALDQPVETLTADQQAGRRLFMSACITCHDRARVTSEGQPWSARAVSYPRGGYSHRAPEDTVSGATPYALHDVPPRPDELTDQQRVGERLFQANCAFCHAADGSGKNWIGSFLASRPRNLTDPVAVSGYTRAHLVSVIRDGLPGTTMSAWRHVLSEAEIDAVAAYVMAVFVAPVQQTQ